MPKLKTIQAVAKRIKITKNNKLKIRAGGQDHFNARDNGKTGRNKKRDGNLSKVNSVNVHRLMPYN